MNTSDIQNQLVTGAAVLLKRHVLIVALLLLGSLFYTVFSIRNVISGSTDEDYRTEQQAKTVSTKFDEATITAIDKLSSPDEPYNLALPTGRTNPFSE
jgi:hypothetical protein